MAKGKTLERIHKCIDKVADKCKGKVCTYYYKV